ncbi:MAG: bifunctional phosphoribosyl-AMP cyclohydrolase/phosphoribosyl-ATP diphosphatase HisIE [Euryarchaeota archaeon]|nr:bifunctional phosphoribosyl-AMP cyclohydrolase/phosphoribosyl-ATP diphosphatase HisIE [Euryarchaeota archaeon]
MIISSIDLMDGKTVQLRQGEKKMLEREDTFALARNFDRYGKIAVIDLDAAMNKGNNAEMIKELLSRGECRVGGGVRTVEKARELVSLGAEKVIIGSKAFENDTINHAFLEKLTKEIGEYRLIIAIDALHNEIVTDAWKHTTGLDLYETVPFLEKYASEFLFTCVEREGTMKGIDMPMVKKLTEVTTRELTVAGGVSTMGEVAELSRLGVDAQLGMALYKEKIDLAEAFIESLSWKSDLIPTITQNTSGQVLMLAYSSKESLKKAFETRKMWYFSRSRGKLWQKGESSGNTQKFIRMRADCDRDAVLTTVNQKGVACHTGSYSCFGDKHYGLHELHAVLRDRLEKKPQGSYTASLSDERLREKILEEAQEVMEARTEDEVIWESADVMYFLTVLLAKHGISVEDVLNELARRRKK